MRDKSGRTPIENAIAHILAGVAFLIVSFFLTKDLLLGAVAATFFFLGRERRDYEIKARIPVRNWYRGWNLFKWDIPDLAVIPFVWIVYLMFR
ncbi:hypothetical protein RZR97_08185 [Hydrogenimonas thermophila]|uniref:hypothetical protein n=1 Tax=Hydrogenimonas thermophila TaxID=223786 RepID=UPI002937015B|nr:hypothetical protein [Hydrogenimonas thermophila]WOE69085.1 hypothetical protein RZR91_08210 [Hydrogenimonas thermophila]WOE71595.1 hypothetical protein RZR97_08185 [Hydrogenimonas thermophila]